MLPIPAGRRSPALRRFARRNSPRDAAVTAARGGAASSSAGSERIKRPTAASGVRRGFSSEQPPAVAASARVRTGQGSAHSADKLCDFLFHHFPSSNTTVGDFSFSFLASFLSCLLSSLFTSLFSSFSFICSAFFFCLLRFLFCLLFFGTLIDI